MRSVAAFNQNEVVTPTAILWPDEKREWECLVPRLCEALPQFLVFGPYDKVRTIRPGDLATLCACRADSRRCLYRRPGSHRLLAGRQPTDIAGYG